MAAFVFVDWSSATARLISAPPPRPFTPPDLLISLTARAAPARTWMPHGAKGPVSGVSTPSLIGLGAADSLDPPYALEPPSTAANIATAPAAAVNLYRFTLTPSVMPADDQAGSDETRSPHRTGQLLPRPGSCVVDISDEYPLWLLSEPWD